MRLYELATHYCTTAGNVLQPSRAAMMTGRLSVRAGIGYVGPGSNGVFTAESIGCLPENETTIADALRQVGYMTTMVGKVRATLLPVPNSGF